MKKYIPVIFNILALLLAVASGFGFGDFEPAPEVLPISLGIVAVINLVVKWLENRQ